MSEIRNTVQLLSIIMQLGMNGKQRAIPFMLQGPPGIGKTYGLTAIAEEIQIVSRRPYLAEVWSGPQIQAEDASGLPVPDLKAGITRLLPMRIGSKVLEAGAGVVAIDEFGSITNAQEAAFLNFVHGGKLGERQLPETISRGAMMNPEDCASNGRMLSPPAANRFAWLDWELPVGTWTDYMRGGRGFAAHIIILPKDWDRLVMQWKNIIASYISRNPLELLKMPQPHQASCAWPSPRSWENAAVLSAAVQASGHRKTGDLVSCAIESCVGLGHAESFIQWLIDMALPDPEELLADSKNAPKLFPERNDQLTVTMEAVATAAVQDHKDITQRWQTAWEIIGPVFVKQNDVGINAAKILAQKVPPGAVFPKETIMVRQILEKAGLITKSPSTTTDK